MSNYPATGPTARFPPADQRDYDRPAEWVDTDIVPQPVSTGARDNTLVYIVIAAVIVLIYMSKVGAYSEWRAQPPTAEPPPSITIVDNSWDWNMCGVCTDGNASPHFSVQQP